MSWQTNVRKVVPYVPGEQPKEKNIIKINTNECPYPPAPAVRDMLKKMDYDMFRFYPAPAADSLVNELAKYYGLSPKQVFVGVGSDDVIAMSFLTFFNSDKPVFFPDVTYSFYSVWADVYKIPYEKQPLDKDFKMRPDDYLKPNGGIIFPNPNAPTGILESLDTVEYIVKNNPGSVVIVDEAYIDFGGESALKFIEKYENLLIVQTFSKSRAMAGMRIGYAMGSEKLIKYLNDVKFSINSYTMNTPSLILGPFALQDEKYFRETLDKIINTREWMKSELAKLGFEFPDSMSNFVFAKHPLYKATDIMEFLRENRIIVRHFNQPRINDYLRISVGTDGQAKALIMALDKMING